jgi:hypothetical protein
MWRISSATGGSLASAQLAEQALGVGIARFRRNRIGA